MNGTQVVEKEKEKKGKVEKVEKEKVDLSCSPVKVISFQEVVDGFCEKCSNKGAVSDLRKSIVRYALGFSKEGLFNNVLRLRSFPRAEVNALKEAMSTASVVSTLWAVLDMLAFGTSKEEAIKSSLVDSDDLEWTLNIVDLKSLDPKQCEYTLPGDIDAFILRQRLPESKRIETPSKLGELLETFLLVNNYPSLNVELRKLFAQFTMGAVLETEISKKVYNNEFPYRKVIQYINKNYKAIQEAIKSGKGEKAFKDDAEYVLDVLGV